MVLLHMNCDQLKLHFLGQWYLEYPGILEKLMPNPFLLREQALKRIKPEYVNILTDLPSDQTRHPPKL